MFKILVVDDSQVDRALIGGLLSQRSTLEVETFSQARAVLERLSLAPAHLVVTDMQMPEMNGLELVSAVRSRFPDVPIVLVTGQGSEELAAQALKQGAAGYVPKSLCHDMLCDTVCHVLELAQADFDYARLLSASNHVHFDFCLGSDLALIAPLQDLVQRMAESLGIVDRTGALQMGIALEQAITNGIVHGNLELKPFDIVACRRDPKLLHSLVASRRLKPPYGDRRVDVSIDITRTAAQFVVADQGPGFDVRAVTEKDHRLSLSEDHGRGLALMSAFMDRVSFDSVGNRVQLVRQRQKPRERNVPPASENRDASSTSAKPKSLGELVARSDGSRISLVKERTTVGRVDSCDIVVHSSTVSHHHCLLLLHEGWWFVKDLKSTNGVKVNQIPVQQHLVRPGHILSLGSLEFEIDYRPHELGAVGITPPSDPF